MKYLYYFLFYVLSVVWLATFLEVSRIIANYFTPLTFWDIFFQVILLIVVPYGLIRLYKTCKLFSAK